METDGQVQSNYLVAWVYAWVNCECNGPVISC